MELATSVCADCDAKNPQWASINRGVFICDECNSIHRQLGRHISHTKHLHKSLWRPTQLFMVQYLAHAGANRFWEHVLLEPLLNQRIERSKIPTVTDKKPQPDSPLHPVKADFIRKKYLFHGFFKLPNVIHLDDLNQQLHASVRTAVLETSLYLLALGANPNYIHPVKGTSPVHVACQYEQIGQLELLISYGGDVCLRSDKGITPLEIALEKVQKSQQQDGDCSQVPWSPLIDCLVSSFYELTDGLSFYLCRRVPNHKAAVFLACSTPGAAANGLISADGEAAKGGGEVGGPFKAFYGPGHFLVAPKSVKESNGSLEGDADGQAEAMAKVGALDNAAFEDLCIDVYDEAERRLTNSILEPTIKGPFASASGSRPLPPNSSNNMTPGGRPHSMTAVSSLPPSTTAPAAATTTSNTRPSSLILFFLPPNTAYTSVRNQARQKLGRLSMTAFRALVVDVLQEAANRLVPLLESASSLPLAVVRPKMRSAQQQRHDYTVYDGGGNEAVVGAFRTTRATNTSNNNTASAYSATEDPVYDQVALETEMGTVTRTSVSTSGGGGGGGGAASSMCASTATLSISTLVTSPSTPAAAAATTNDDFSLLNDRPRVSETEDSATSTTEIAVALQRLEPATPDARRLRLPATGRLASYRASVPAAIGQGPVSSFSDAAGVSATNQGNLYSVGTTATYDGGSLERCAAPSLIQQSHDALDSRRSASVQTADTTVTAGGVAEGSGEGGRCCAEAVAEVQRLCAEREKTNAQLAALASRIEELELACERLTEENNALKAAFSAGMVKTHEATRGSPATTVTATKSPPPTNESDSHRHVRASSSTSSEDEDEAGDGYTNGDSKQQPQRSHSGGGGGGGASSNYAVGSECLDSGILLHQGISLWARATSPPTETGGGVEAAATATVSAAPAAVGSVVSMPPLSVSTAGASGMGPGSPPRPYVNVQTTRPSAARTPIGKQQHQTAAGPHDVDVPGDYTAPNETGSPSPAPPLLSSSAAANIAHRPPPPPTVATAVASTRLSASSAPTVGGDGGVSGGPAARSASAVGAEEYSVPPLRKSGPGSTGVVTWTHPPYERIVRGVECIIVRIRSLLDAANARRAHEQVRSAQLIQAAVQDLVVLFPPISKCHPPVGAALTSLMSNSQKLRLHCEAHAASSGNNSQLITYAHEIASAAKTILNHFQAERH